MPLARVASALVVGLLGAAAAGPRLSPAPDLGRTSSTGLFDAHGGCTAVGSQAWNPMHGLAYTGRIGVRLPPRAGSLVFIIGDTLPLAVSAESAGGSPQPLPLEALRPGAGTSAPPAYWLDDGDPWSAPQQIVRAVVAADPARPQVFALRLGRRAPRVLARLHGADRAARAIVCAIPAVERVAFAHGDTFTVRAADEEHFATGWSGTRPLSGQVGRTMALHGAVLVRSARRGDVRVALTASAPAERVQTERTLSLRVNDVFAPAAVVLRPGVQRYEWVVPARAWVAGTNELLLIVSRTTRTEGEARDVGLALHAIDLGLTPTP